LSYSLAGYSLLECKADAKPARVVNAPDTASISFCVSEIPGDAKTTAELIPPMSSDRPDSRHFLSRCFD